ncbi:unnamed protein product [Lampetra fluviatilis]
MPVHLLHRQPPMKSEPVPSGPTKRCPLGGPACPVLPAEQPAAALPHVDDEEEERGGDRHSRGQRVQEQQQQQRQQQQDAVRVDSAGLRRSADAASVVTPCYGH